VRRLLNKASMVARMSYKASKIHGDIAEQLQAANRAFLFVAT